MFEFLEVLGEIENLPSTLVLWVLAAYIFLWLPGQLGYGSYTLMFRITGTVVLLPITYIIVQIMANK